MGIDRSPVIDYRSPAMQGLATTPIPAADERIVALEAALAAERALVAQVTAERDVLHASHERLLRLELELLRRRLFVAKAERVNTAQLELEFAAKLAELDRLCGTLGPATGNEASDRNGSKAPPRDPKKKPTGRHDLRKAALEEERIEIPDPLFEQLVTNGKAERIGHEESCKLAWKRGGLRRLVLVRVKYRAVDAKGRPRSRPHRYRLRASCDRWPRGRGSPTSSWRSTATACR